MTMGRKKTSGAFSLFSFQDIITSVTAILILVMLLLTIELITKRRAKSASDPVATRQHLDAVLEELESTVTRMRREAIAASHAPPSGLCQPSPRAAASAASQPLP